MPDLSKMNDAQRQAAVHGEGPMLVLAGPGSGKTFTITNRISYLIEHYSVLPEHILVITFTKDAALSMQRRFMQQEKESLPVIFGTFHSVFYQIIKQSRPKSAETLLKDSEKKQWMLPILTQLKKKYRDDFQASGSEDVFEDAVRCLAAISYYKNTGDMDKAAARLGSSWKTHFEEVYTSYENIRRREGRLDFDDMVFGCLHLLREDKELLASWQKRFKYILIDEFQDINSIQYQVVRLLCAPPYNLFAVGDDDQSIYGFRGSQPSLMKQFLEDYPQARRVLLGENYRSRHQIVNASLKVIALNKDRFTKELKSHQEDGEKACVHLQNFEDKESQYGYIAGKLEAERDRGTLNCCACLFRTNAQMQGFASYLTRAGIPYSMKEKASCIYDHFIARDVRNYMIFAGGERGRSLFLTIMNKPSRWLGRELVKDEEVDFNRLKEYIRTYAPTEHKASLLRETDRLEKALERLKTMKPYLGIQFIRKSIGYERYLEDRAGTDREKLRDWQEVLESLASDARNFSSCEEWLRYQDYFREELARSARSPVQEKEGVKLMTAHASKGLEFDRVFVPDVNEGVYPHGSMMDEESVEEERRMLYVAMTRAKEALELLFVTGTKERPRLPSRFLNPLMDGAYSPSSSTISSNSQVSRYSSKASATFSYSSSSSMKPSSGSSLGSSGFSE